MAKKKNVEINNEVEFTSYFPDYDGDWKLMVFKDKKTVNRNYVQTFRDCVATLAGLSSCANDLIKWIAAYEMSDDNRFHHTEGVRDKFIRFMEERYGHSSVKGAITELVQAGALISVKKPDYLVNALYYWRGSKDDYLNAVMLCLEFSSKNEAVMVVEKKIGKKWYDATGMVMKRSSAYNAKEYEKQKEVDAQKVKQERLANPRVQKVSEFNSYGAFNRGDKIAFKGEEFTVCKVEGDYVFWVADNGLDKCHKQDAVIIKKI